MPKSWLRCSTNMSHSSNVPASSSSSMRSRAVSLPLACCASMRFSPPPRRARGALGFELLDDVVHGGWFSRFNRVDACRVDAGAGEQAPRRDRHRQPAGVDRGERVGELRRAPAGGRETPARRPASMRSQSQARAWRAAPLVEARRSLPARRGTPRRPARTRRRLVGGERARRHHLRRPRVAAVAGADADAAPIRSGRRRAPRRRRRGRPC